jgi:uncharacterized protein YijF (DUF1287 family)
MKKQNIEQIIRELFKDNYRSYPEQYFDSPEQSISTARYVAKGYWANRTDEEIERDEKAQVTESDYVEWVLVELSNLIPEAR